MVTRGCTIRTSPVIQLRMPLPQTSSIIAESRCSRCRSSKRSSYSARARRAGSALHGPLPPRPAYVRVELSPEVFQLFVLSIEDLADVVDKGWLALRVGRPRLEVRRERGRDWRWRGNRRLGHPQPRLLARRRDNARRMRRNVRCPPALVPVLGDVPNRLLTQGANRLQVLNQANSARTDGGIGQGQGCVNSSRLRLPASRGGRECDQSMMADAIKT